MTREETAEICRALSDSNRLHIIEILVTGEHCACSLNEKLNITQPTLSHHMKVLSDCKLVIFRKEGNGCIIHLIALDSGNSKSL